MLYSCNNIFINKRRVETLNETLNKNKKGIVEELKYFENDFCYTNDYILEELF